MRNGSVTISINVTGYPPILPSDITWLFNNDVYISDSEHHVFAEDRTSLTILNAQTDDRGTYTITASNIVGQSIGLEIPVDVYGKNYIAIMIAFMFSIYS